MSTIKTLCELSKTVAESNKDFLALSSQEIKFICKRCSRVSNIKEHLCRGKREMPSLKNV